MKNNASNPLPKLCFTRGEAAEIINVSPATLDRLVRRQKIHPLRDTRRPMFPIWEIERFLRGESEIRKDLYFNQSNGEEFESKRRLKIGENDSGESKDRRDQAKRGGDKFDHDQTADE